MSSEAFSKEVTIFFSNLPFNTTEEQLNTFIKDEKINIKKFNVETDTNKKETMAFVELENHEDAQRMIDLFDGKEYNGNTIIVNWKVSSEFEDRCVIIKGLKKDLNRTQLKDTFSKYGAMVTCRVLQKENKTIGFVSFVDAKDFEKVQKAEAIATIKKEIGTEDFAIEKSIKPNAENSNIYVSNLSPEVSKKEFEEYFKQYGDVMDGYVVLNEKKESGKVVGKYGYVYYKTKESAQNAIAANNGKDILKSTSVVVEFFISHSQRQKERTDKMNQLKGEYKDRTLFIKRKSGLPITDEIIKNTFEKFGEIHMSNVNNIKVKENGVFVTKPSNACYIAYENKEVLDKVMNDVEIQRLYEVKMYKTKEEVQRERYTNLRYNDQFMDGSLMVNGLSQFYMMYQSQRTQERREKKEHYEKKERHTKQNKKPTEEEKNTLGDEIYDYIESLHKYSDDDNGQITGILLESFNFYELKRKFKNGKQFDKIVAEVYQSMKEQK